MYVLVIMVMKKLERLVLQTVPTFVNPALVTTTKRVVLAVPVWFVELENEKPLLVLQQLIVFVLKMFVLVKTVFKLLELLVRLMVPIFVPRAPVDITKQVIYVLETKLLVA